MVDSTSLVGCWEKKDDQGEAQTIGARLVRRSPQGKGAMSLSWGRELKPKRGEWLWGDCPHSHNTNKTR